MFTNGPFKITSSNLNFHDKSNQNIDVSSKVPITTESYSSSINDLPHTTNFLIQNKPLLIPYNINILGTNVTDDKE